MTRAAVVALSFLLAPVWAAENPDPCAAESSVQDIRFDLALKDHTATFQAGEVVPLALAFSTTTQGRYIAMAANSDRSGRVPEEHYCVTPEVPDPLESYYKGRGVMGGGLRGLQPLDETPFKAEAELNEWRSLPPGHYSVYAVSHRILRPADQRNELLRSNAIEIEVSQPDPAWQAEQLRMATETLAANPSREEAIHAARVLRFLDTPGAAREMAKLFWGLNQQEPIGWTLMFGLYGSPHRQTAIDAMRAQIAAPDHAITGEFLDALVNLQLMADPKWANAPQSNPAQSDDMQAFWAGRTARERQFMQTEIATVVENLPHKTPGARALTLNGLLTAGENNPALAQSVRPALIAAWADLPAETQSELILYRWPLVAGTEMVPILRKILAEPPTPAGTREAMTRNASLKHLYEIDPAAGREAILSDLHNPKAEPGLDAVGLLPKEDIAVEVRAAAQRIANGWVRDLEFQMIDRFADAGVLPAVQGVSAKAIGQWRCTTQAAMLRYFLRVSPEFGAHEVAASMAARKNTGCYRQMLQDLGEQLPKAQQSALDALDDPDPEVSRSALEALGLWGSKDAEAVLWERLKRFHAEWEGRADELRGPFDPKSAGSHGDAQEWELMKAIGTGTNWICPPEKLTRLRDLVWTKAHKQEIEGWMVQWNQGPVPIGSYASSEDRPKYAVLQYNGLTEEQLLAKIAQLPERVTLEWRWQNGEAQDAVYQRVRAAASAHGLMIDAGPLRQ